MTRTKLVQLLRPTFQKFPLIRRVFVGADEGLKLARHSVAAVLPAIIQPAPERLTVAITARCNLRCIGCRYGRDFMPNQHLPSNVVLDLLTDAAACGFVTVRLYGGEPLMHRDLPLFIRHALQVGIRPVVTTNGILLERRIHELYDAGLRLISIGYYGSDQTYDDYVQRPGSFAQLERSVAAVRAAYGSQIALKINYLLAKPTCSVDMLRRAWDFAQRYRMMFQLDLVHYSLPYFTEGPDQCLQFTSADGDKLHAVVEELLRMKASDPDLYNESIASIRSIADWAIKGPAMNIPCDAYKMIWVGADGTVQLCYAAFPLGNLHESRLKDLMARPEYRQACRRAFELDCPHCHCERTPRIQSHLPSRLHYGRVKAAGV